jgi:nucleotide-binding universal stress UspA family protein
MFAGANMNTPSPIPDPAPATPTAAAGEPALVLGRILVPLDFSEHAAKALRFAAALARQFNATLVLVHIIEPLVYPADFGYTPLPANALEQDFEREATERLAALAGEQRSAGLRVEHFVRVGKPYHEIAVAAAEQRADLVVLTTHGYTGLTHVLLGSTAERVIRHAPCPVLVVRAPAQERLGGAGAGSGPGREPRVAGAEAQ